MNRWQYFLTCILLHLIWPLIPLLLEKLLTGDITEVSIALAAGMYAVGIGLSSRYMFLFFLCLVLGFIYSAIFGFEMAQSLEGTSRPGLETEFLAWFGIITVFLIHAGERVKRHLKDEEKYPEFIPEV